MIGLTSPIVLNVVKYRIALPSAHIVRIDNICCVGSLNLPGKKLKKRLQKLEDRAVFESSSAEGSQPVEPHLLSSLSCQELASSSPHLSQSTSLQECNAMHSLQCTSHRSVSPLVVPYPQSAPADSTSEPLIWLPYQPLDTSNHLPASLSCPTTSRVVEHPLEYKSYLHKYSSPFQEGYAAMTGQATNSTSS
jgi:hypothetical protein